MKESREEKKSADIRARALNLLSYRARSVNEIRLSLKERGYNEASIEETIGWLKEFGYLNDSRFAFELASSRVRNKNWGTRKIAFDLKRRGIDAGIISEVLEELSGESEESAARRALEGWLSRRLGTKDFPLPPTLDNALYASAFRHLQSRGFTSSTIYPILKNLKPLNNNEIE